MNDEDRLEKAIELAKRVAEEMRKEEAERRQADEEARKLTKSDE